MRAGILGPGTCGYIQHAYPLSRQLTLSWVLGYLPMPGSLGGDAPALQKYWNRQIWRLKKWFSQQRFFPASGSEPSITAAPEAGRAGLEAEQSPGQRSQAPGEEDGGAGRWDRGAASRPVSASCRQGPGDPETEPEPGDGENLSPPWGAHRPPAPLNPAG